MEQELINSGELTAEQITKLCDLHVEIFKEADCPFELMHCISTYPMNDEDANLNRIKVLRDRYQCSAGYSGHEIGLAVSYGAAALGNIGASIGGPGGEGATAGTVDVTNGRAQIFVLVASKLLAKDKVL